MIGDPLPRHPEEDEEEEEEEEGILLHYCIIAVHYVRRGVDYCLWRLLHDDNSEPG